MCCMRHLVLDLQSSPCFNLSYKCCTFCQNMENFWVRWATPTKGTVVLSACLQHLRVALHANWAANEDEDNSQQDESTKTPEQHQNKCPKNLFQSRQCETRPLCRAEKKITSPGHAEGSLLRFPPTRLLKESELYWRGKQHKASWFHNWTLRSERMFERPKGPPLNVSVPTIVNNKF